MKSKKRIILLNEKPISNGLPVECVQHGSLVLSNDLKIIKPDEDLFALCFIYRNYCDAFLIPVFKDGTHNLFFGRQQIHHRAVVFLYNSMK